ncbi:MAG: methionine--tRNA ligase [Pseudomonadota bacterium]|nr:methionine--tRNA ligase [Pseudomonadota bacterium]
MAPKILVTTALVYANGPLHLGHLVEQIQADIWVRALRLGNTTCIFISGDDAHGTPIMLSADKLGISPEEMISKVHKQHEQDSRDFLVDYDYYDNTHNDVNKEIVYDVYQKLNDNGYIYKKNIDQSYDQEKEMFLPDRFIKGTCPKCGAHDQYGDNCEVCGASYNTTDLLNPYSILSNTTPVIKKSEHYFFKLNEMQSFLSEWLNTETLQPAVKNKLQEWLGTSLRDWDISRDAPYFGFKIPGTDDKYFYVWLDAPIGYFGSLKNYSLKNVNITYSDFTDPKAKTEIYHFIGKDITYFHGLFWPAMLKASNYKTPTSIFAHGFLTVNGEKMSKSRGTFITAREYLDKLNPEFFRYYLATRLSDNVDDLDLNWEEFVTKINSDLIGKVINIASRTAGFINKKFDGKLATKLDNIQIIDELSSSKKTIINYYKARKYNLATTRVMQLADLANQYIAQAEPWKKIKEPQNLEHVHEICSTAINLYRIIIIYLSPILPVTAKKSMAFLNVESFSWDSVNSYLVSHKINKYSHILERIDIKDIPKKT